MRRLGQGLILSSPMTRGGQYYCLPPYLGTIPNTIYCIGYCLGFLFRINIVLIIVCFFSATVEILFWILFVFSMGWRYCIVYCLTFDFGWRYCIGNCLLLSFLFLYCFVYCLIFVLGGYIALGIGSHLFSIKIFYWLLVCILFLMTILY